ncbi:thiopeptide-type bacteriocin biosynthesis protein [Weeksellaceae bacterium A-14]
MKIRKFSPGSEWLYLKIYCGVKTSDIILQEAITPLIADLKKQNLIKKWFFIRYNDPKPHLRFRVQLFETGNYNKVLDLINLKLKEFIDSGEISNIVIDTYSRELERYGKDTIEFAEDLFFKSSELVLNFLDYDDEEKIIVSLFYIEQILSEFKISEAEKLKLFTNSNDAFKKEFNADKNLNNQLKKKFLEFKPKYEEFINSDEFVEIRNLIIENVSEFSLIPEKIIEYDFNFLDSFFASIFHMHINRTFLSNQRLFEMVVYDYLVRNNKMKSMVEKIKI